MEKELLEKFKKRLLRERKRVVSEIANLERTLQSKQSEFDGENDYENHMGDLGTATFSRESDVSLERNARDLLAKIDAALERIEKGTYGYCEVCRREIDLKRLEALPWADLDIEHQRERERAL